MREFRASAGFLVFLYSSLTAFTLGGLAVLMFNLGVAGAAMNLAVWLPLLGLALLGWAWSVYLHIPFIIVYQEDQGLEFKSFFRVVTLFPGDIKAIRRCPGMPWFLQVRHIAGKFVLTRFMTDMPELIALIKRDNPAAEVSVGSAN
jgi:hypothetical protein